MDLQDVRRGRDAVPALRKVGDLLRALLVSRNGLDALCTLLRYISDVSESSDEELRDLMEELQLPEASEALMTMTETLLRRGREQGAAENQRENLIKLLRLRFGSLPRPILARIRRPDLAQMNYWFVRGAAAKTLVAVSSDSP